MRSWRQKGPKYKITTSCLGKEKEKERQNEGRDGGGGRRGQGKE